MNEKLRPVTQIEPYQRAYRQNDQEPPPIGRSYRPPKMGYQAQNKQH